jgi:HEAT repeat protein
VRIRIISLLGDRRDAESIEAIAALVFSGDKQVGEAAVTALGKIGGTAARRILAQARAKGNADLKFAATDAYLRCAEGLAARGHREEAVAMYKELAGEDEAAIVRSAAIRGLANVGREKATPFVIAALHDENRMLKMAAMSCVREMLGVGVTERFAAELPKLPPSDQVLLIGALTNREDRAALPAITKATSSKNVEVRTAAMYGLAYFGDASCVEILVRAIESDTPNERKAAIFTLQNINPKADTAIEKFMQNSQPAVRSQLIEVLADRHAVGAVPALQVESANPDPKVRRAAFKALGRLADQKDLPALVKLLVNSPGGGSRDAERAVITVSRKITDENERADVVLAALSAEKRIPVKCSLLRVLGGIANSKALDTLAAASRHTDPTLKDAAVRTLAQWPNGSAAKVLLEIYGDSQNKVHRLLALRGFARLLALPAGDRPAAESLELCRRAMTKTHSIDEKKLVLSALGNVAHPDALTMAEPFLENEKVGVEAAMAATKIAGAIGQTHPAKAKATLNKVLLVAKAPHLRRQAQDILRHIEQAQSKPPQNQ